jgi:hypothetical protein
MSLTTEFMIGFGFALLSAILGVWWRLQVQITEGRRELDAFKLQAAKDYVGTAALLRMEGRLDEGFKTIRDEMRDQNALIIGALAERQPSRRSRSE